MKKGWNKVIIISFVLLALVVGVAVIFLFPYYNMYKVFDGIEAGRWEDVKDSYDSLDARQQEKVQESLPSYAKHVYAEYASGKRDYTYTVAAYDAINSIDETGELSKAYLNTINYVEYKKAIDAMRNSSQSYDNRGGYDAQNTIAGINKRIDNETRELILIEILNEKYLSFIKQEITATEVEAYCEIIATQAFYDAKAYIDVVLNNVNCVTTYRSMFDVAQNAYDTGDYFTAINICQSVILDPDDSDYIDKYYDLYSLAYATGMNYYDNLLDQYITIGDNKNAVALMEKLETYFAEDMDLSAKKLKMASDWQRAYVSFAENFDAELKKVTATGEDDKEASELPDIKADSILLQDIDKDGVPEAFFFDSTEGNDTYTSCYIFTYSDGAVVYLGYAKVRSFCKNSSFVAFPWASVRESGDEFCLKLYADGAIEDGSYCQDVDGTYYVNEKTVDEVAYLSARSEILENSIDQGVMDLESATLLDSESYILAY